MTRWLLDLLNRHWHREDPETQDDPRLVQPFRHAWDDENWPTVRERN